MGYILSIGGLPFIAKIMMGRTWDIDRERDAKGKLPITLREESALSMLSDQGRSQTWVSGDLVVEKVLVVTWIREIHS